MPITYFCVEKLSPISRSWTERLLAIDARRRYVFYSSEIPPITSEEDVTAAAKKMTWKKKIKLDDFTLYVDVYDIDVESPTFDERQLYTIELKGASRPLLKTDANKEKKAAKGKGGDGGGGFVGVSDRAIDLSIPDFKEGLRATVLAALRSGGTALEPKTYLSSADMHQQNNGDDDEDRDELSMSPILCARKAPVLNFTVRCGQEYTFMKMYTLIRNSLVVAGIMRPIHVGLPPYDPRNHIRFPVIPLHLRKTFSLLENAVIYTLIYGQLTFLSQTKDPTPLSLRSYLCITPQMVAIMRPDATIPRWATLQTIESVQYQVSRKKRGPFVAFLTSGDHADVVFEPLPPPFPKVPAKTKKAKENSDGDDEKSNDDEDAGNGKSGASSKKAKKGQEHTDSSVNCVYSKPFKSRKEVQKIKEIMEKLMPLVTTMRMNNGSGAHVKYVSDLNILKKTVTSENEAATEEDAQVVNAAMRKKQVAAVATEDDSSLTPRGRAITRPHSTASLITGEDGEVKPYTLVEVKGCKHVLQYMDEQEKFAGRKLKWVPKEGCDDVLHSFLPKGRLATLLGYQEDIPVALRVSNNTREAPTSPLQVQAKKSPALGAQDKYIATKKPRVMISTEPDYGKGTHAATELSITTPKVMLYPNRTKERTFSNFGGAATSPGQMMMGGASGGIAVRGGHGRVTSGDGIDIGSVTSGQGTSSVSPMSNLGSLAKLPPSKMHGKLGTGKMASVSSGAPGSIVHQSARLPVGSRRSRQASTFQSAGSGEGVYGSDDTALNSLPQSCVTFMDIPDDFEAADSQLFSNSQSAQQFMAASVDSGLQLDSFVDERLIEEDMAAFPVETSLGDMLRTDQSFANDGDDDLDVDLEIGDDDIGISTSSFHNSQQRHKKPLAHGDPVHRRRSLFQDPYSTGQQPDPEKYDSSQPRPMGHQNEDGNDSESGDDDDDEDGDHNAAVNDALTGKEVL